MAAPLSLDSRHTAVVELRRVYIFIISYIGAVYISSLIKSLYLIE